MSNHTMHAVRFHEYGNADQLVYEEAPRPEPKPDEVLVHVHAAGVNPADNFMRAGFYKAFMPLSLPHTPGLEASGEVEAVGADVTAFQPGQAVFGIVKGGYAEYAVAPAANLALKPESLTFDEAAAVPMGALTARNAVEAAEVQAGQHVLVHGAAGGVGLFAVQLARLKGAHVTGTASADNQDFVRSLGAEAIDYNAVPFETVVHDMDVVIDTVGGETLERSWQVLRPGGTLVTVAARLPGGAGQQHGVRALSVGRSGVEGLGSVVALLESGQLKPQVGRVFPLAQARRAQQLSQTRHGRGRILLHTAN
jgi:NADPH:quinone reductase-like Zn-dependent oxidoreductase